MAEQFPLLPSREVQYEVHEHAYIRGRVGSFFHSHEGGDQPHQHADTGPACYTIDRDEWRRATGASGGGRKKFTRKPEGTQLPSLALEPWQTTFEVIVFDRPAWQRSEGPGVLPIARMIQAFRMAARVHDETSSTRATQQRTGDK